MTRSIANPDTIRLLIIADDPLARSALAALLEDRPEVAVVGQVPAEDDLLANLDLYRPDVLLWDLGWAPEELPAEFGESDTPLLVLLPDDELAAPAWAAGALGLLLREEEAERLVVALQTVAQGLIVLDPDLAEALRPTLSAEELPPGEELTPREVEVLQLLAEGLSNRAIGQELEISEHTVKFHVTAIMGKLEAQSRTEAVVRATRLGLILL